MRLAIDDRFWLEQERFRFRFCCEDCVHFDPAGDGCVHGWPCAEHRRARYDRAASRPAQVIFCKEFELR